MDFQSKLVPVLHSIVVSYFPKPLTHLREQLNNVLARPDVKNNLGNWRGIEDHYHIRSILRTQWISSSNSSMKFEDILNKHGMRPNSSSAFLPTTSFEFHPIL